MPRKIQLDYSPEYDFLLYAIVSVEPDYRLIWDINRTLNLDFIRTADYSVFNKKLDSDQLFSSFSYLDENSYIHYRLISNNSESGMLLEELKGIDYLILVAGDFPEAFSRQFGRELKKTESIQNVFPLDPSKLKSRDRLTME